MMKDSCTTFFLDPPKKHKMIHLKETYMILGPSLDIWTLHTRHLSVSSSNLLDRWPFTSTVGQKYCLKNALHQIHSRKLTWNLKMMVSNRNLLFQVSIFGCHVSFRGCRTFRCGSYVEVFQFNGPELPET